MGYSHEGTVQLLRGRVLLDSLYPALFPETSAGGSQGSTQNQAGSEEKDGVRTGTQIRTGAMLPVPNDAAGREAGGRGQVGRSAAYTHPLSFQKMELALVPLSAHGNFYEGDCYVILSVSTISLIPKSCSLRARLH